MLHTLNYAYVDLLARQVKNNIINNFLCVYDTDKELALILEIQNKYKMSIEVISTDYVVYMLKYDRLYNIDSEKRLVKILAKDMYDDILISHNLHDVFAKDFLSRHCHRKGG